MDDKQTKKMAQNAESLCGKIACRPINKLKIAAKKETNNHAPRLPSSPHRSASPRVRHRYGTCTSCASPNKQLHNIALNCYSVCDKYGQTNKQAKKKTVANSYISIQACCVYCFLLLVCKMPISTLAGVAMCV